MNYSRKSPTLRPVPATLLISVLCLTLLIGCGEKPLEPVIHAQRVEQKVDRDLTARAPAPLPPRRFEYKTADAFNKALGAYIGQCYTANVQKDGQLEDIEKLHGK